MRNVTRRERGKPLNEGVSARPARNPWTKWAAALVIGVAVSLAACASGGSVGGSASTTSGATQTTTGTTAGLPTTATDQGATPTTTAISGPSSLGGSGALCAQTANVTAQLPSDIPAYTGAQLRVSENANGYELFGYCTSASPNAVMSFYTSQLPTNGWQQITTSSVQFVQQLLAVNGNTHLALSVEPDPTQSGETDIIIQLSNS